MASFTKQHFDVIAEEISNHPERFSSNRQHAWFAADMADTLARHNQRLSKAMFIMACMPSTHVGTSKADMWEAFARRATDHANTHTHK